MKEYFLSFLSLFLQMAPYLLLGFMIAGMLHAFVPSNVYRKWLGGNDLGSVLRSVLIGIPLPLCSCGVIPTAVSMRKEGASKGAATAFLISTPQTGIDSIATTYSVLGLPFAILRPVAALLTGLFSGVAVNAVTKHEPLEQCECAAAETEDRKTFLSKCKSALEYGFSEMIQDIGVWLIVGLILAGLINIFVPDNFFSALSGRPVLLAILLFRAMILRFTKKKTELKTDMMEFKVTGMMCNHCKMHVQTGIAAVKGVESVEADLAGGKATVKGTAASEDVVAAVKALGYECELITS